MTGSLADLAVEIVVIVRDQDSLGGEIDMIVPLVLVNSLAIGAGVASGPLGDHPCLGPRIAIGMVVGGTDGTDLSKVISVPLLPTTGTLPGKGSWKKGMKSPGIVDACRPRPSLR